MHSSSIEHGVARPPTPVNERVRDYAPGSAERAAIAATLKRMSGERIELPLFIDGQAVETGRLQKAVMPHEALVVPAEGLEPPTP